MKRSWILVFLLGLAFFLTPKCAQASIVAEVPKVQAVPYFPLVSDIDQNTAKYFRVFLGRAKLQGARDIEIDISSAGGDAEAALDMYRALRASGMRSTCYVRDLAASGAAWVLEGCTVRVIQPGAKVVIHSPFIVINHPVIIRVEDAVEMAGGLVGLSTTMNAAVAERLGISVEDLLTHIGHGQDWILTADQAVAAHAADRVGSI